MNAHRIRNAWTLLLNLLRQGRVHARLRREGVELDPRAIIKGACRISGKVRIGANTLIQACELDGRGGLWIGDNAILDQCVVLTAQHDIDSAGYPTVYAPVSIEDYVIIYRQAIVLPGRTLGRGAVVAAGSVVTRDVPAMAVVAGNPARVIRTRATVHDGFDLQAMGGTNFLAKFRSRAQPR